MTINGCATAQGTRHYRERFKERISDNHFRLAQDLSVSSIGIGTYLGEADEAVDARYVEAVSRAVELGANVIDTAANYRFQRSERAIGRALRQLIEEKGFAREELLICTKGGYLPFDNNAPTDVRRYVEETFVCTGIAQFSDFVGGSHAMTPHYLQSQLDRSLQNMQLSCIDVYYIHNPEAQLARISRAEFDERLRAAFAQLEEMVARGKIKFYGVATWNGFRVREDARAYHSLARMCELARETNGQEHHFRFIQLPFNLAMPEALTLRNQTLNGKQVSLLGAASALGLTVVASASILQGEVARHSLPARIREALGALSFSAAQTAIQLVRSTPGVTCALVGMSRRAHVEENLQLTAVAPATPENFQRLFVQ
jgi:aryl-alcohol dehydrogenase-like predicted oxidoreductase